MPTRTIPFTNEIEFSKPFVLVLGRKRKAATKGRFVHQRLHLEEISEETGTTEFISNLPVTESYSLFLDDKLFSVTRPTGTRRFSVKIVKPTKGGPTELHLVKKYTTLQ